VYLSHEVLGHVANRALRSLRPRDRSGSGRTGSESAPTSWTPGGLTGRAGVEAEADDRFAFRLIYYVGMFGTLGVATVVYIYKPDTRWV